MDELVVSKLSVRTQVGFSPHEIGKLQDLKVTVVLKTDLKKAGESDCVENTINLKCLTKDIMFHLENKRYNLIEAVAADVALISVVRYHAHAVKITVEKPYALRFTESSKVIIQRKLEDFALADYHISIGSNIDPIENIRKAIHLLQKKMEVMKVSKAFKTTPVGYKDQADFINMAALVRTRLDSAGLKQVLLQIEKSLGRERDKNNKNAPRTIDLDISFNGSKEIQYCLPIGSSSTTWSLPDPDTLKHAHVIIPLADVTPDFIHPRTKRSLQEMARDACGEKGFITFFPTVKVEDASGNSHVMNGDDFSISKEHHEQQ